LEDKKLREQIRAITGANLSASSPDRLTNTSAIFNGARFDAMTIENRKSPLPALPWHLARRPANGRRIRTRPSPVTLADREHIAARQGEAKLQLPKVRRPRIGEHRARRRHFRSVFCSKALQQTTALEQFSRLTCTA
jgi:hypothetical protein